MSSKETGAAVKIYETDAYIAKRPLNTQQQTAMNTLAIKLLARTPY